MALDIRYQQRLIQLDAARNDLKIARDHTVDELEYGGAATHALDIEPLERIMKDLEGDLMKCEAEIRKREIGVLISDNSGVRSGDLAIPEKIVRVVRLGEIPRGESYVGSDDM